MIQDHSGGNLDFVRRHREQVSAYGADDFFLQLKKTKVPCYGGSDKVPGLTNLMKDGDEFTIGDSLQVKYVSLQSISLLQKNRSDGWNRCIHTPCHTQDSICYFVSDAKTGEVSPSSLLARKHSLPAEAYFSSNASSQGTPCS